MARPRLHPQTRKRRSRELKRKRKKKSVNDSITPNLAVREFCLRNFFVVFVYLNKFWRASMHK
jgi:hypothetical protein